MKSKLLLHVCCGPCATEVIKRLKQDYEVSLFFYNPNIHPKEEYDRRLDSTKKLADIEDVDLFIHDHNDQEFFDVTEGMDNEPEGGRRCEICFDMRLDMSAKFAKENGFDIFTSSISISPYKNHFLLKTLGEKIEKKYGVKFLGDDFKKNQGYEKSIILSKEYGLYRQKYCGCIYSKP